MKIILKVIKKYQLKNTNKNFIIWKAFLLSIKLIYLVILCWSIFLSQTFYFYTFIHFFYVIYNKKIFFSGFTTLI